MARKLRHRPRDEGVDLRALEAKAAARAAFEAGSRIGVDDNARSMARQQRGGGDMDHPLDIAARRQRLGRDERLQQRALGAGRERTLIEHPLERFRVCPQRPLDIEAHDVAGPLPDGIDRRLAIESCQRPVLDIAIAAEALHRFEGKARQGLADAVFDRRRHQPNKGFLRRIRVLTIEGAGETEHQRGCRLDLERQIAQHLAHQRCSMRGRPKAMRWKQWLSATARA
jgi:hypothetical protein